MKKKKILIINSHPRQDSFCDALAREYRRGAEDAGHKVHFVTLRNLKFDPIMRQKHGDEMLEMESSLLNQQKLIKWCNHLVIITPMWWMGMPALLKGYLDRVLAPDFAFSYRENSKIPFPIRLLKGRSARVIYTQGGPQYIVASFGGDAFWKAFKYGVLIFCGFGPVRRTLFDNIVKETKEKTFEKWLKKVYKIGTEAK
ncbi:MAG: NAD(P)H-dependent oxidoreductase [bacterium]|nr:NAD(P)H-dependent oxidoreductase [bacterium]